MHASSLQIWITLAISTLCQASIIPPRNVAEHSGTNVFHENSSALKVETEPGPTHAPVVKPKKHPKSAPTHAPVPDPTTPPVPAPTQHPVPDPTEPPTDAPVTAPSEPPVLPPTDAPVTDPTETPVLPPTDVPTAPPTKVPRHHTKPPTTLSPSNAPVSRQTDFPSLSPIAMVTLTLSPTTESPSRVTPTRTPSLHTDMGDSSPTLGGGNEWVEMTIPTDPPIPYVPPEDDVLKDEKANNVWLKQGESIEEMEHDKNVFIALITVFVLMLLFSIFIAYQMLNNPDGCCAR
jgi:hypothetical protein